MLCYLITSESLVIESYHSRTENLKTVEQTHQSCYRLHTFPVLRFLAFFKWHIAWLGNCIWTNVSSMGDKISITVQSWYIFPLYDWKSTYRDTVINSNDKVKIAVRQWCWHQLNCFFETGLQSAGTSVFWRRKSSLKGDYNSIDHTWKEWSGAL